MLKAATRGVRGKRGRRGDDGVSDRKEKGRRERVN